MSERIWHKGPPPHVGWWNASACRMSHTWRWWNGEYWSQPSSCDANSEKAAKRARIHCSTSGECIEWSDYYPENARVPRVNPNTLEGKIIWEIDAIGTTIKEAETLSKGFYYAVATLETPEEKRPWWKFWGKKS